MRGPEREEPGGGNSARRTIFIVEDNPIIGEILTEKIEKLGFEICSIVRTGEEAIEYCRHNRPDLVIMDITLEGEMDGIEAGKQIREQFGIPFIFVTAHIPADITALAKEAGPSGYIVKPFSNDEIRTVLKSLF